MDMCAGTRAFPSHVLPARTFRSLAVTKSMGDLRYRITHRSEIFRIPGIDCMLNALQVRNVVSADLDLRKMWCPIHRRLGDWLSRRNQR